MNRTSTQIALVAAMATTLGGCQGVWWGNVVALGVTVCLFFGTLQLGRRPADPTAARAAKSNATRSISS